MSTCRIVLSCSTIAYLSIKIPLMRGKWLPYPYCFTRCRLLNLESLLKSLRVIFDLKWGDLLVDIWGQATLQFLSLSSSSVTMCGAYHDSSENLFSYWGIVMFPGTRLWNSATFLSLIALGIYCFFMSILKDSHVTCCLRFKNTLSLASHQIWASPITENVPKVLLYIRALHNPKDPIYIS